MKNNCAKIGSTMLTLADRMCLHADKLLRTVTNTYTEASRPNPGKAVPEAAFTPVEKRKIAGLMRINHAGEVCAQALYHGQSLTARLDHVRAQMDVAQQEEIDHLVWCQQRLAELGSHTSFLNPLWYVCAFSVGALAGCISDRWSLGFVAETEAQVVTHLKKHLDSLPEQDKRSAAILAQMQTDEDQHRSQAQAAGGVVFPGWIKKAMALTSRVMTGTAYWL